MAPLDFSACIVAFRSDPRLLSRAVASLAASVADARANGLLREAVLFVVDNGDGAEEASLRAAMGQWPAGAGAIHLVSGHGNLGYGRANNLVLPRLASDVHLVMNPDVELDREAIGAALGSLEAHPDVALLAPAVRGDDGAPQFLCKRYPSVAVLYLRGFAPAFLRDRFRARLDRYEMRDAIGARFAADVPLASGAFMVVRTEALRRVGGFDPAYFMYFEDYDLSLRLAREGRVAYEPAVRIVHHGGEAARKGARHVAWFVRSAWRFFSRHGWRIA